MNYPNSKLWGIEICNSKLRGNVKARINIKYQCITLKCQQNLACFKSLFEPKLILYIGSQLIVLVFKQ